MHPNPSFRQAPEARSLDFARSRGFGTLLVNGPEGPLLAHVPFLLSGNGRTADLHLVRSNPILRAETDAAVIAVTGPDSYISPDWYGVPDQVPTWNYVAVHLRGRLIRLDAGAMRDMVDRQSAAAEAPLAPKPIWQTGKMTPEVRERMMRQIVPCRLEITRADATWKVSQNKPDEVRLRAADGVEAAGLAPDAADLAHLMRNPPG
ncbi:FMN-binding negative transcriptional regulator [Jannaschia marina]|uniref:FMN-binding negative transcriptional regulator n=1 Tax=Jannaschia marina TaxID=2741674 RepID=UPI0015C7D076|nr:FMN-binding negative transcriptional regulator [Jannaschia marina]